MSEKHRLLRRTQMKRHDVDRIGGDENVSMPFLFFIITYELFFL